MSSKFKDKVLETLEAAKTSLRRLRGGAHYRRWGNPSQLLSPDWEARTEGIAKLIPAGSSVLEFGAARMTLRKFLPDGCKYTPTDLVDRGEGTIVCDLNARELPAFPPHDVAVFSGVLEYVNDVPRLVAHISHSIGTVISSYSCVIQEQVRGKPARRASGWVNDYTSEEFEGIFLRSGFHCDHVENWSKECNQRIYRFTRGQAG